MLKDKRPKPPVLVDAENRIERWRTSLLADIAPRLDVAMYILVLVTCERIGELTRQLMPRDPSMLEQFVRSHLFGLQFALSGLKGDVSQGKFLEELVAMSLTSDQVKRAVEAIDDMYYYSVVRDAFLGYTWGVYDLETPREHLLRFVNPPEEDGGRDRAEQIIIAEEIKQAQARQFESSLIVPAQWVLEQAVDVLPSLSLDGLTATQFVTAWRRLGATFAEYWWSGQFPVMERTAFVAMVARIAQLSHSVADRFVSLLTFDRSEKPRGLTLFHCPLVPVSTTSLLVVLPGFIFGNPTVCIPRLAVYRGRGIDAYSKKIEAYLLNRLKKHFQADGVMVETNIPYSGKSDRGDIDLVIYETASNRLLIGQVKAFIMPDTVDEVARANRELAKGLQQVERVRQWLQTLPIRSWGQALKVPLRSTQPSVQFAVIGNGFAGSDYLTIPQDISVVNASYLLLPRFAGQSIFDALHAYQRRLAEESRQATEDLTVRTINLAGITIELPSWSLAF